MKNEKKSQYQKGLWKNEEYREKMCKQSKELWSNENYRNKVLNKIRSEETREKISKCHRGKKLTDETKKLMQKNNVKNKQLIINGIEYLSVADASRKLNIYKEKLIKLLLSNEYPEFNYKNKEDVPNFRNRNIYMQKYRKKKKEESGYIKQIQDKNLSNLKDATRNMIGNSIRKQNYSKKSNTVKMLGCSYEELKKHIELQFENWMTWENKGLYNGTVNYGWDIDHIIPISSAKTEEELLKLFHYTNLQPLCSYENRCVKKNKFNYKKKPLK